MVGSPGAVVFDDRRHPSACIVVVEAAGKIKLPSMASETPPLVTTPSSTTTPVFGSQLEATNFRAGGCLGNQRLTQGRGGTAVEQAGVPEDERAVKSGRTGDVRDGDRR